jgi:hypothetical protein
MEDLGKSFPAAEGLVDANEGQKPKHVNEFCLNCGTKLEDLYYHHSAHAKKRMYDKSLDQTIFNFALFSLLFIICLSLGMGISAMTILFNL